MATATKFTITRGQQAKDVTIASGTTIGSHDAIEVNIDIASMTNTEIQVLLEEVTNAILNAARQL